MASISAAVGVLVLMLEIIPKLMLGDMRGTGNARGAEIVENLMRTGPVPSQTWTQR
jgi:hypothetical protein